jgi:hypothetical protein
MAPPSHLRVVLDLQIEGELIQGLISTPDQCGQPFFGWLELASQLQKGRTAARDGLNDGLP